MEAVAGGGIAGVAVDVPDLRPGEQLARVRPGLALVVGDERALVVVHRAREAVQPPVHGPQVRVGDAAALGMRAPVEDPLRAPHGRIVRFADAPTGQVVGLVLCVDGEPAAVGAAPQGGHVVVVGLEPLMEDHDLRRAGRQVDDRELDVARAGLAAGAFGG
ncbi:hypothetical protein ADL26_08200, partial [Thermoactinomyces vulgaris]